MSPSAERKGFSCEKCPALCHISEESLQGRYAMDLYPQEESTIPLREHLLRLTTLITPQHTLHQIPQRSPKVPTPISKTMLLNKKHIMLEARIQMRFQTKIDDDRVMMAIDVRINPIESLEDLEDEWAKGTGEGDADAGREHCFIVYVGLHPGHEVLDVFGSGHFGGLLVGFGVLPEVFESVHHYVSLKEGMMR